VRIIAMSASYGAGGSVIAPLVAEHLGVPYLDRAIAAREGERMQAEVREAAVDEEQLERGLWQRMISALAATPNEFTPVVHPPQHPDRAVRDEAERRLREFASGDASGVVLGWAAPAVLPGAFCVRLDGPVERRLLQGMKIEGLSEADARRRLDKTDDVRRLYWRRLYQRDWRDPDLYHLSLDSTAISTEAAADLVERAAAAFWDH
jgi:cytidylate kinase